MTQVWLLDEDGFYLWKNIFVEEVGDNMTIQPLLVGYIKPKWNGSEWEEGATEQEILEWKQLQPKTQKSDVEFMQEQLTQLIINQL